MPEIYVDTGEYRDEFYQDVLTILSADDTNDRANEIIDIFDNLPAADVRPERHGYWKGYTTSAFYGCDDYGYPIYRDVTIYYCSLCHRKSVVKERFCPNCGAKMDGKF